VAAVDTGAAATLDLSSRLAILQDPKWPNPEWASMAALRAPFLSRMLQVYVFGVSYACCKCIYVEVAYVAMVIHVCCCKRLFQMFQLFQTDVARVLSRCYICFTLMLQVFHPDVV
jgi:hypothetical protein